MDPDVDDSGGREVFQRDVLNVPGQYRATSTFSNMSEVFSDRVKGLYHASVNPVLGRKVSSAVN